MCRNEDLDTCKFETSFDTLREGESPTGTLLSAEGSNPSPRPTSNGGNLMEDKLNRAVGLQGTWRRAVMMSDCQTSMELGVSGAFMVAPAKPKQT